MEDEMTMIESRRRGEEERRRGGEGMRRGGENDSRGNEGGRVVLGDAGLGNLNPGRRRGGKVDRRRVGEEN